MLQGVIAFDGRNLFAFIMSFLQASLAFATNIVDNALTSAGALSIPCLTIVLVAQGLRVSFGVGGQSAREFGWVVLRCGIIVAALNSAFYIQWVQQFFISTVSGDVGHLASSSSTNWTGASGFDVVLNKIIVVGFVFWDHYSIANPAKYISILVWGAGAVFIAFGFGVYLLGWVLMVLYVDVGPFFILAAMFATMRGLFSSWIGCLIGATLLEALAVILTVMVATGESFLLNYAVSNILGSGNAMIGAILAAMIALGLCSWVAKRLPAVATTLAGGVNFYPGALGASTYDALGKAAATFGRSVGARMLAAPARAREALEPPRFAAPPGPSLSRARP